jgi:hypothetical protein
MLGVGVVDPQPAAGAVLERFGHVGAKFVDHQPDPGGRELLDPLAGLHVR